MAKIYAVHFLQEDMCSRNGNEKPWKVGETRTVKGELVECEWGYHYSPDWESAIKGGFLYGPMACIVRVDDANLCGFKGVTATRTLVEAYDVTSAMRAFAADEAERALMAERKAGREPDPRSWAAMKAAWGAANGTVTLQELSAARSAVESAESAAESAARSAAWSAAESAAWSAARSAAWSAAESAAWSAAESAAWSAAESAESAAESAARSAAWSAARSAQAKRFNTRLGDATGWWPV